MAQLTDLSDIISRQTGYLSGNPETIFIFKTGLVQGSSGTTASGVQTGRWTSLWTHDGQPSRGAIPTTATTCDNTTAGSIQQVNPNSGQEKWLMSFNFSLTNNGGITLLYDRLVHVGGLSAAVTTEQTINTPPLSRYSGSSSVGNKILVEVYSALGVTQQTATITYTNQDGVSGKTTSFPIGGGAVNLFSVASAYIPVLASGDTGVISIESVQLNNSTSTAGNFGVSIIRPIQQSLTGNISISGFRDPVIGVPNVQKIENNSCLALLFLPTQPNTLLTFITNSYGFINFINK